MHPGNAGPLAQPRPDRLGDGTGREFVTFKLTQIGFDHWAACMRDWSAEVCVACPDPHFDLEGMIADGDRVVTRVIWTGTHRGEFWGVFRHSDLILPHIRRFLERVNGTTTDASEASNEEAMSS